MLDICWFSIYNIVNSKLRLSRKDQAPGAYNLLQEVCISMFHNCFSADFINQCLARLVVYMTKQLWLDSLQQEVCINVWVKSCGQDLSFCKVQPNIVNSILRLSRKDQAIMA